MHQKANEFGTVCLHAFIVLALGVLSQVSGLAQTSTATLVGTVRDSSGAVLPSVH
jgi:hypothetical protein